MDTQPARHSVSVSGVIPDDHGRVLLIRRRDNQHWEPPGGVLELDETIHDGLRREIREETGLDIEPDALTGVYKNMPRGIIALVFRCKITGGHLTANDEVTAFRWADEADIRQLTSEAYAVRLLDALREGTRPPSASTTEPNYSAKVIDALHLRCVAEFSRIRSRRLRCAPPRPGAAPGSALEGPPGARRASPRSRLT